MKTQTEKKEQPAPKPASLLAKMRHHETRYVHAYNSQQMKDGRFHDIPIATVALVKDDTYGYFCGFSFCSKKDNFSRRTGRKVAFSRANSLYEFYNTNSQAVPLNAAKLSLGEAESLLEELFAPENRMSRKRLMSLLRHARQDPQVHYDFIAQDGDFDDDFDDDDEEDLRMVDKPDRLSRWSEEEEEEEQLNLPPAQATIPVVQKLNTKTTAVGKNEPRLRW